MNDGAADRMATGASGPPPRRRPLSALQFSVLLASLLAGVAAALAAMPAIFRATPTDISRIGTALVALRAPGAQLRIVVTGNSSIMSGIDAGQLSDALPGNPLAWNLATPGQSLLEAAFQTQELPASVDTVVYATPLRGGGAEHPLPRQMADTYALFGFRPEAALVERLGALHGDEVRGLLTRSWLSHVFEARWAVRQLADTQLRILLRSDLKLTSAETSLLHPQRYTVPVLDALLARQLAAHEAALETSEPRVPAPDRALLRELAEQNAAAGRRTVVLVPPVHPALWTGRRERYARGVAELAEALAGLPRTRLVDASTLLGASEFIDDLHPTNEGARRLTRRLADAIAGRG